jgi:uncharacterized membrane protein YccC
MGESGGVTHEQLKRMLQRMLDEQERQSTEIRLVRQEMRRMDRLLWQLQRGDVDRRDAEENLEDRLAHISRRMDRLEDEM